EVRPATFDDDDLEPAQRSRRQSLVPHLAPLAVLLLLLLGVIGHDLFLPDRPAGDSDDEGPTLVDPNPVIALRLHDGNKGGQVEFPPGTMCFGLVMKDPANPGRWKKLMWDEWGRTNNTVLRVDGRDFLFGHNNLIFERVGGP